MTSAMAAPGARFRQCLSPHYPVPALPVLSCQAALLRGKAVLPVSTDYPAQIRNQVIRPAIVLRCCFRIRLYPAKEKNLPCLCLNQQNGINKEGLPVWHALTPTG